MKKYVILTMVALALWTWPSGCASHELLQGLTVELASVERTEGGEASVTVRFVNATVVALNMASSTHKIFLNGQPVGTLTLDEPLGIPAQSTMPQTGTMKLAAGLALASGETAYRLESVLSIRTYGTNKEVQKLVSTGTAAVK
jgi:hypothetical protein